MLSVRQYAKEIKKREQKYEQQIKFYREQQKQKFTKSNINK
jgi:vacuolar-type H+-ATPase subunit H